MNHESPKSNIETLRIIWQALLSSLFMYGIALHLITQNKEAQEFNLPIIMALTTMAVVMCVLSFVLPNILLNQAKKNVRKDQLSEISILIHHYSSPYIIKLALLESCALFGFGLAVLHNRIELFYPFGAISLGLFLMNSPKEEKIRNSFK